MEWWSRNHLTLNKTKEMVIDIRKTGTTTVTITILGKQFVIGGQFKYHDVHLD